MLFTYIPHLERQISISGIFDLASALRRYVLLDEQDALADLETTRTDFSHSESIGKKTLVGSLIADADSHADLFDAQVARRYEQYPISFRVSQ